MARAFVIRPFEKKADGKGRIIDFEEVHQVLIQPALDEAGLQGSTTGEIVDAGNIREDMFSLILEAPSAPAGPVRLVGWDDFLPTVTSGASVSASPCRRNERV
jgi:hypothetical protein